jgi:hypothetical protein
MVAICESEKTAIIASIYLPKFIWLACGGSEGLNTAKMGYFKNRNVVLFPDCGMYHKWSAKAKELSMICSITVSSLIEERATDLERQDGFDLADYLVQFHPSDFKQPTSNQELTIQPQTTDAQNGRHDVFVSDEGVLYIPTPPDRKSTYTVYQSIDNYNNRSETPLIIPFNEVNTLNMKQLSINPLTLTI